MKLSWCALFACVIFASACGAPEKPRPKTAVDLPARHSVFQQGMWQRRDDGAAHAVVGAASGGGAARCAGDRRRPRGVRRQGPAGAAGRAGVPARAQQGGTIVVRYAETRKPDVAGVVLSAPALGLHNHPLLGALLRFNGVVAPWAPRPLLDNDDFSRDRAVVEDMDRDPLIFTDRPARRRRAGRGDRPRLARRRVAVGAAADPPRHR